MISRHYSLTNGFLVVLVLIAMLALVASVSADNSQTITVPNSGKYPLPPLHVNSLMEPVILTRNSARWNKPVFI